MKTRDILLKCIWEQMTSETDESAIRILNSNSSSVEDEPLGDLGALINKFVKAGISYNEIARFAKCMQYEAVFGILGVLAEPDAAKEDIGLDCENSWILLEIDQDGNAIEDLSGIRESLMMADPTGREMRPRPVRN